MDCENRIVNIITLWLSLWVGYVEHYFCFTFIFVSYSVLGLSILQNGVLPTFLSETSLQEIFDTLEPGLCYKQMRQGFKELGIYQVSSKLI